MRFAPLLTLFALINIAHAETLTIFNWEEYLSDDVIKQWEQKSGHTIKQIYYDNDEDRDTVLIDYSGTNIDLVIADEMGAKFFGKQGKFVNLNQFKAPNITNVDPEWQGLCGQFSIPYLWGTLGVVYRTDKLNSPPTSWQEILKPSDKLKLHYGLMEDYVDLLSPALLTKNKSINTSNPSELKEAFEDLKEAANHALTFEYSLSFISANEKKDELYLAIAYSGDQYGLNEKTGKEVWSYTTLKEGSVSWVDCLAVLESSPRKQLAYDFINFIYDPKIAAQNSEAVYVASPISKARALQSEEFLQDESVYPPTEVMKKIQRYESLSDENTLLRNRITASLVKLNESK